LSSARCVRGLAVPEEQDEDLAPVERALRVCGQRGLQGLGEVDRLDGDDQRAGARGACRGDAGDRGRKLLGDRRGLGAAGARHRLVGAGAGVGLRGGAGGAVGAVDGLAEAAERVMRAGRGGRRRGRRRADGGLRLGTQGDEPHPEHEGRGRKQDLEGTGDLAHDQLIDTSRGLP
jgi:hypothetical protein